MATIVTRSGKGSPLTNNEVDANFTNLNTELGTKANTSSLATVATTGAYADLTGKPTIASADGSVVVTGTTNIDLSVAVAGSTSNVVLPIRNTTGATLAKGTAVYISGATGQISTVSKAIATGDATSAQTLGLVTANIANNSNGNVTLIGTITNIDTSAYTDGQQLYLSPTTAGTLTATKPYAPQHLVYVAVVEHAHPSQGKLFVKVQNGYEMDELHNVSAQSPANNDGLFYNTSTSLWEKKSIATALGFTPYNATNPAGYITGITSGNVTTALGYTPANRAGDTFTGIVNFSGGTFINGNGDIHARRDSGTTGVYYFADGGTKYLYWDGGQYVFGSAGSVASPIDFRAPTFYDNNNTSYYMDLSGSTSINAGGSILASGNITLNNGANRYVRIGSATNYSYDLQTTGDDFQIIEAGTTPRLTIKYPNGNLGLGNVNPQSRFTIGSAQGNSLEFTYSSDNAYRNIIANYWNSSADTRMDFNIGRTGNVAPVTVMSVGYNSNVGLNTTTPAGRLSVVTGSSTGAGTSAWSSNHSVFGPNAGSATGAAVALGYNTTADAGELFALAPAVAWKPLNIYSAGLNLYASSGGIGASLNGSGTFSAVTDIRAPIFYDSNDTSFYTDPSVNSVIRTLYLRNGSIPVQAKFAEASQFGYSSSYKTIVLGNEYLTTISMGVDVSGNASGSFNGQGEGREVLFRNGVSFITPNAANNSYLNVMQLTDGTANFTAYATAAGSFRAPIFYDSNNTAYYVDPNGGSRTGGITADSLESLGNLTVNSGLVYRSDWTTRYQSGSDFTSGTLVTTDIPATGFAGESFIIEITGKSYSATNLPFKVVAQGYLYNDTIINYTGISYGGDFATYIKVFEEGGVLKFWWPRISYWNSFNVNVMAMDGATNNTITRNRVTAIANSTEPTGTKKQQINLSRFMRGDVSATNSIDVRAPIFYDSNNTAFYADPDATTNLSTVYGNEFYSRGWFRNNNSNTGLYNQETAQHWWSDSGSYWNMGGGNINGQGIRFRDTHNGTVRGYVYYDQSNNVGFLNNEGNWRARVVGGDYFLADGSSARAQLFYDSNNTGYYVDPNSTSNLVGLTVSNTITGSISGNAATVSSITNITGLGRNSFSAGVVDGLTSTNFRTTMFGNAVGTWNIATSRWNSVPTAFSGLGPYGTAIAWSGADTHAFLALNYNSAGAKIGGGSGDNINWSADLLHSANYTNYAMPSGASATNSVDVRAPIFYDSADTYYYVDANSTSRLNNIQSLYLTNVHDVSTNHPYGMFFSNGQSTAYAIYRESGAWTHPYPDLRIAFHTGIKMGANAGYGGMKFYTDYDMSSQVMSINNGADPLGGTNVYVNNSLQAGSSLRAPIFYDSNDTNYYLDPASTSNLNRLVLSARNDNYFVGSMAATNAVTNFQSLTNTHGQMTVMQCNDINGFTNGPTGLYQYGAVMSWRTESHSYQFYASHTGDIAYKTQWSNDNYSGWLTPMVYGRNGGSSSGKTVYGSIYYDSDNTGYYIDANSTSRTGMINADNLRTQNNVYIDQQYGSSLVGAYNASRYQGVYAMGDAYKLAIDGTTAGNLYGIAWAHPNAGGVAANLNTHGALFLENGGFLAAISGSIRSRDDMRAPIFYDSNNTGYYLDAANASRTRFLEVAAGHYDTEIRLTALAGEMGSGQQSAMSWWVSEPNVTWNDGGFGYNVTNDGGTPAGFGRLNTSFGQAYTRYLTDGTMVFYCTNTSGTRYQMLRLIANNTVVVDAADIRAPLYYDNNDSAFYLDPNSTGTSLNVAGSIVAAGNVTAYSDIRIKANVETIPSALDKLDHIRGVTYTRTDLDDKEQRYAGVIAQEIEKVLPEAVRDLGNIKAVDYNATIGLLIQAVKELRDEVEAMKSRLH